jgi:hypothetical protein
MGRKSLTRLQGIPHAYFGIVLDKSSKMIRTNLKGLAREPLVNGDADAHHRRTSLVAKKATPQRIRPGRGVDHSGKELVNNDTICSVGPMRNGSARLRRKHEDHLSD